MNTLRRLVREARDLGAPRAVETCELCSQVIGERHDHLVDLQERSLRCSCRACALLFDEPGAGGGRYRTVPNRVLTTDRQVVEAAKFGRLGIPVSLAFLFFNSKLGAWVAVYPSPAGPVESEPAPEIWDQLRADLPLVDQLEPDVEALLVRGRRGQPKLDLYLAPISSCYRLVARLRQLWRGFEGGDEAHRDIEAFFEDLAHRSRIVSTPGARS